MKKVFIDPGHGGKDPGATGNGIKEKDITLSVSLKVGNILKRHNLEVFYSRTKDEFIDLSERATMANNKGTDVFVSIHCNSFSNSQAQGLETFSYPNSKNGTALSKCIQDSLLKDRLYTKNRGLKTANFAVLRETKMTAALIEMAFISNKEDSEILKQKQNELAESVARGILNFLGIKYKAKVTVQKINNDIPSSWAKDSWNWGIENKITDGTNPKEYATREEIITMIKRSKEVK